VRCCSNSTSHFFKSSSCIHAERGSSLRSLEHGDVGLFLSDQPLRHGNLPIGFVKLIDHHDHHAGRCSPAARTDVAGGFFWIPEQAVGPE
jgi:hypothetical protein